MLFFCWRPHVVVAMLVCPVYHYPNGATTAVLSAFPLNVFYTVFALKFGDARLASTRTISPASPADSTPTRSPRNSLLTFHQPSATAMDDFKKAKLQGRMYPATTVFLRS